MTIAATSPGAVESPGFFGKVPALGDFVQRRLPGSFVKVWDGWLQGAVASSKAQLGEHWLDTYLSSPVWRFALLPGISGETGWTGVIMPSVDRVGRYFPLSVVAAVPADISVFGLPDADHWYTQAESTLLSALDDQGFELDVFDRAVASLGPCQYGAVAVSPDKDLSSLQHGWHIELNAVDKAASALRSVAELIAKERFSQLSIWWTSGSELITPSLLVYAGLPAAESYTAMLDGRWQESNWQAISSGAGVHVQAEETTVDA